MKSIDQPFAASSTSGEHDTWYVMDTRDLENVTYYGVVVDDNAKPRLAEAPKGKAFIGKIAADNAAHVLNARHADGKDIVSL